MTAIQVFKKYGAHYYDDDEEAIIKAMDEYAESKAKEAFDAARQLDKPVVKSETDKGIEAFEAYTFKDYETYKNRKHE